MKRMFCLAAAFLLFCSALFLAGCGEAETGGAENCVRVVVIDNGEPFTPERQVYSVKRGEDITVRLKADGGYTFDSCDYGSYFVEEEAGMFLLTLTGVRYSVRVDIRFKRALVTGGAEDEIPDDGFRGVRYYLNGGRLAESDAAWFEEPFTGEYHLRANTNIGTEIVNAGHTLLGWNTQPDGSGEHIGLGSRVTVPEGERVLLYAEWAPWTDASLFTYEEDEGGVALTAYTGDQQVDRLVIPSQIGGKDVVRIAGDFAPGLEAETLVLPPTLQVLEDGAFAAQAVSEIYLYDSIAQISDDCFAGERGAKGIRTVRINAARKPCFIKTTDNSYFAEAMDRLILNADKKKMVFFAGCSFSYGLDSSMVEHAFGGEYTVCNMGVVGGTNATFQLDCITRYLGEGDIFVHAPEEMNPYQLLYFTAANTRMFMMVESNYDLLAMADLSEVSNFWDSLNEINDLRDTLVPEEYNDVNPHYNQYGDINFIRPDSPPGSRFETETLFKPEYIRTGTASVARLNEYYGRIEDMGASVFFSYAPANVSAFSPEEFERRSWESFDATIRGGLDPRFSVISEVENYIFDGQYFFDTDYHLTVRGAQLRTQQLIEDMRVEIARNHLQQEAGRA